MTNFEDTCLRLADSIEQYARITDIKKQAELLCVQFALASMNNDRAAMVRIIDELEAIQIKLNEKN